MPASAVAAGIAPLASASLAFWKTSVHIVAMCWATCSATSGVSVARHFTLLCFESSAKVTTTEGKLTSFSATALGVEGAGSLWLVGCCGGVLCLAIAAVVFSTNWA